jgi:hypothetical protein
VTLALYSPRIEGERTCVLTGMNPVDPATHLLTDGLSDAIARRLPQTRKLPDDKEVVQPLRTADFEQARTALLCDGVVVWAGGVDVGMLAKAIESMQHFVKTTRTQHLYSAFSGIDTFVYPPFNGSRFELDDQDPIHVIHHATGRSDVWPMDSLLPHNFSLKDPIPALIADAAKGACRKVESKRWGLLPVAPATDLHGHWHRDTGSLFHWEEQDVVQRDRHSTLLLPNWYFTCFVPLVETTNTEYLRGSHMMDLEHFDVHKKRYGRFECVPGDVVIMNGKVLHRGVPNPNPLRDRLLLYQVWAPTWFNEFAV